MKTGNIIWKETIPKEKRSQCRSVSFSADGKRLAAIVGRNRVDVWESKGKVKLAEFETARKSPPIIVNPGEAKKEDANSIRDNAREAITTCLSPDGRLVAIGSKSNMAASTVVEIWNVDSRKLIKKLIPEKGGAKQVQFSPDGKQLVTAGHSSARGWVDDNKEISSPQFEDSLILWDLESGKPIRKFGSSQNMQSGPRIVNGVTFSPDGKYLITAERAGTVLIYEAATGKQLAQVRGHNGRVSSVAMSGDGKRLVSVSQDLTGLVWDFRSFLAGVNNDK